MPDRRTQLQTVACTFRTCRYNDVCVGLVGEVLFYPSLCAPYPFFRTSMTSLLPLPPSHPVTLRPTAIYLRLSLSSPSLSSTFAPFPFHFSRFCPLCCRKNRESGRGRYTPVPIHTILPSRPPLRGSAAHTWIGAYVRKDCEKARGREGKQCARARARARKSEKRDTGKGARDVPTMKKKNRETC